MFPFELFRSRRFAASTLVISSLSVWASLPAFAEENTGQAATITLGEEMARPALPNSLLARAAEDEYTITGSGNRTVTPAEWSNIVVAAPDNGRNAPDIKIGSGTTTLTGQNGQKLFDVTSLNHNEASNEIVVSPNGAAAAVLRLLQGAAQGNLSLRPVQRGQAYYGASLLVGSGQAVTENLPTVTLTGNISTRISASILNAGLAAGRQAILETQGAHLIVNGSVGFNATPNFLTQVKAHNGNITINWAPSTLVYSSHGNLNAYVASARNGFNIFADSGVPGGSTGYDSDIFYVDLGENSHLELTAPNSNLSVHRPIGEVETISGMGGMAKGSLLQAVEQVSLIGGVTRAAGTISSLATSIVSHDPNVSRNLDYANGNEILQASISQGGSDPLKLHANIDILLGETSTDSLVADYGDIIAGSMKKDLANVEAGRIFTNASRADGYYFPRLGITANTIQAPGTSDPEQTFNSQQGRVIAGEINMPLQNDKSPELTAAHIYVAKKEALTSGNGGVLLPASTGNLNITGGTLRLTSAEPLEYHMTALDSAGNTIDTNVTRDYASQVDGDMSLENVGSSFTSLNVDGQSELTGGKIVEGGTLKTGIAIFSNVSSVLITDTLEVVNDFTASENGESHVKKTLVGGTASVSGGSYAGEEFTGQADVGFSNVANLEMSGSLSGKNITVAGNDVANVTNATAQEMFSLAGGSWTGQTLQTGSTAEIANVSDFSLTGKAVVGTSLAMTASSGNFADLWTGSSLTVTNGSIAAGNLLTGASAGANGDVTVTDSSFAFGLPGKDADGNEIPVSADPHIQGNLVTTGLKNGSFGNLLVDGQISMDGGQLSGDTLHAGGDATFTDMTAAQINNSLSGANISFDGNGERKIAAATATGAFSVSGGSYEGGSLESGGDVRFENTTSVNVDGKASFAGNLRGTDNKNLTFANLETGAGVTVTGGVFNAGVITTGNAGTGDVTLDTSSYTLGDGGAASQIRGDLAATGNGKIGELAVTGNAVFNGGFVEGSALSAAGATLKNNVSAHIDSLTLAEGGALEIDTSSVLTVNSISGAYDDVLINSGTLVILGESGQLTRLGDAGTDYDLESGAHIEGYSAELFARDIGGKGQGSSVDDIRMHRLEAANVDIMDANIFLTGMGKDASVVTGNLRMEQNGDTRLGDMNVGGEVSISGGGVRARKLVTGDNAKFTDVDLNLTGMGEQGSVIDGNLDLANESSQLGDITVTGTFTSTGGAVAAGVLKSDGDVVMNQSDISLNGLKANPSHIKGNLVLKDNKAASLWHIDVDGGISGNGGEISAHVINVGQNGGGNVELDGASLSLRTLEGQQSVVHGDMLLKNNQGASLGTIAIDGKLEITGGQASSTALTTGGDATFSGVELTLVGTPENPDKIGGDLQLDNDSNATLGALEVTGAAKATGGKIDGESLSANGLDLSGAETKLTKVSIAGEGKVGGGSLAAVDFSGDNLTLGDGVKAALQRLMLDGDAKSLTVGAPTDANGGTEVVVNRLSLNGGLINVGNLDAGPATLAVGDFNATDTGFSGINGNLAVGKNGRLLLGNADFAWLPASLAGESATLALAKPTRLGRGYGIHVTGEAVPTPQGGRIMLDSSSLVVINGADARVYYTGEFVKSALLSADNGAVGALSAESATTANVGQGAQIYIRNPIPNTVIVALGENIQTVYADVAAKSRADDAAWKDANLIYDNGDQVRIERLEGEYAGQFSVMTVNGTPEDPQKPGDLTPETPPTPPVDDTPDQPQEPVNPPVVDPPVDDTPDQPQEPVDPPADNPSTPPADDTPDQPQEPEPKPKPAETHPNAGSGIHDVIGNETNNGTVGPEPHQQVTHNGAGFLSHTITHENPHEATHLVEGAARVPLLGAVPRLIFTANEASHSAMGERTSLAGLGFRQEDIHARDFALWAVPLYKAIAAWNLTAGNHDYDYHGGLGGVAIGGDYNIEDILRLGISFNIGAGYAKSGGELPETSNNMSFWGLGAYGVWSFAENFALSGSVAYTSSYNKVKQDVSQLAGWSELKSDIQAQAISAGLALEYHLPTSLLDIYPHAGVRYHYIIVNDYTVTHQGNDIIKGESFSQNIWTFPIGVTFSKEFVFESGWQVKPMLDLRVTPVAGDIDARSTTRFTGTSTDLTVHTQTMDWITYGGSLGLEAKRENFSLGISYNVEAGLKKIVNGVFGTLRYEF